MTNVCPTCKENISPVPRGGAFERLAGNRQHGASVAEEAHPINGINDQATLQELAPCYHSAVAEAALLFRFVESTGINYSSAFTPLLRPLEEAAHGMLIRRLKPAVPSSTPDRERWLTSSLGKADRQTQTRYRRLAEDLKVTLILNKKIMPIGLLRSCISYALDADAKIEGVFQTVRKQFSVAGSRELLSTVTRIYNFRNTRVAHQERDVRDRREAQENLALWIAGLKTLTAVRPQPQQSSSRSSSRKSADELRLAP